MITDGKITEAEIALMHRLNHTLNRYDYNGDTLGGIHVYPGSIPLLAYRFRDDTPENALIRLFLLGLETDRETAERVLAAEEIDGLVGMGILKKAGDDAVQTQARIFPYKHLNLICDFMHRGGEHEIVYPPGGDSVKLAESGLRIPFGAALDLCVGSGIQALLSAQHCETVTAVDINPRAVYFSKLNLALNGLERTDIVMGDLYEPVTGNTFDYITANPPFVTTPITTQKYRDGGDRGDKVLMRILDGLPDHLNEGGYAQIVTHLYEFEDLSHIEYIDSFAKRHGYQTMLFLSPALDKYALTIEQLGGLITDYERYKEETVRYLEHLDRMKYQQGFLGVITFRNSGSYNFKKLTTLNRPVSFDINLQDKLKTFYGLNQ